MTDTTVAEDAKGQDNAPAPAAASAQDDESLDSILAAFDADTDQGTQPTQQQKEEPKSGGIDRDTADLLKMWAEEQHNQRFNEAIDGAVSTMKDATDVDLPDRVWKGILYQTAEDNPLFKQAYVNRGRQPAQFAKALRALAKEVSGEFKVSKTETDTRDAVNAAVKASAKKTPANQEGEAEYRQRIMNMTPQERTREKQRLLGRR